MKLTRVVRSAAQAAGAAGAARAGARAGRAAAWRVHAYGGRAELRLDDVRVPALRAPDDVLIEVHAASINPLDVAMLEGYGSRLLNVLRRAESVAAGGGGAGGAALELPLTAGRDCVGRVARAGPAARVAPGARVWAVSPPHRPGTHQHYLLARDAWVSEAPATLDDLQAGGALYAGLTACSLLRAAGLAGRAGRAAGPGAGRVLLLGLGGVGQAALQLLVHRRRQVTVGCAAELAGRARALGAAHVLDRHAADYERALVDFGPYEAVLDCAGLGGGAARGARGARGGRYVTLSSPLLRDTDARGVVLGAASAAATLARHSLAALGSPGAPGSPAAPAAPAAPAWPPVRWAFFWPRAADVALLARLAERGEFTVCVEATWSWREAPAAYARAAAGHARGKLLLDFTR